MTLLEKRNGRFYWLTRRTRPFLQLWRHGSARALAIPAARIRFSLHKEFRDGEIRLYLPKEFRAAELGGDASENGDFQREKQRLQGPNVFKELSFYIQ